MARNSNNTQLKTLVKSALSELLEENQQYIQSFIEEAVEQAFMSQAIKVGRKTKKVSRNKIFEAMARHSA